MNWLIKWKELTMHNLSEFAKETEPEAVNTYQNVTVYKFKDRGDLYLHVMKEGEVLKYMLSELPF